MQRTTKPDHHSASIKTAYLAFKAGKISRLTFAGFVSAVWGLRNAWR